MPISEKKSPGIAEVVINHPPVNALDVAGWFDLADRVTPPGGFRTTGWPSRRAEGRGFCAAWTSRRSRRSATRR